MLYADTMDHATRDEETCGANPEALLLGDTVPLYLAVSWFQTWRCLVTSGAFPPIRQMCCDGMV